MRIVMMGTGAFAAPTFEALLDSAHDVPALVTQPPREGRGHRHAPPSPMRAVALERQAPILDPVSINAPEAQAALEALRADVFIVADYGQILAPQTLAIAPRGGINLHGSLLPKYRGAAPINWALWHGDRETGVTVIHMTPAIDAGPAIARLATPIGDDETAPELEARLARLGAPLVLRAIEQLAAGTATPIEQDASQASRARRLRKSDGEVDWTRPAAAIRNQIRALEPWPRTSTAWHAPGHEPLRLILGPARVPDTPAEAAPGTIQRVDDEGICVATGDGVLVLERVQPAGKRLMSVAEFTRGHAIRAGERLGPA